jgi:hypothetical protein
MHNLQYNRDTRSLFLYFHQSIQDTNYGPGCFANELAVGFIANKSGPPVKPIRVKHKEGFSNTVFPSLPVRMQGRQHEGGDRVCSKLFG